MKRILDAILVLFGKKISCTEQEWRTLQMVAEDHGYEKGYEAARRNYSPSPKWETVRDMGALKVQRLQ